MTQLLFNFPSIQPEEGMVLDPQPPRYSECWETNCDTTTGVFDFYLGNSDDGHYCVQSIKTENLKIEPQFDDEKGLWMWKKLSEETKFNRDWYKNNS